MAWSYFKNILFQNKGTFLKDLYKPWSVENPEYSAESEGHKILKVGNQKF